MQNAKERKEAWAYWRCVRVLAWAAKQPGFCFDLWPYGNFSMWHVQRCFRMALLTRHPPEMGVVATVKWSMTEKGFAFLRAALTPEKLAERPHIPAGELLDPAQHAEIAAVLRERPGPQEIVAA